MSVIRGYKWRIRFFGQKESGAERVTMATALRASFCFFRGFSAKWKNTVFISQFAQLSYSANERVIDDLHSPDTFGTHLGEWASANCHTLHPPSDRACTSLLWHYQHKL